MTTGRVRFIGFDEAGLGPYLGPLALGGVAIDAPADWRERNWWEALAPNVSRGLSALFPIDDSKKLFPAKGGREAVARTVAGVVGATPKHDGRPIERLEALLELFASGCLEDARLEHWFEEHPGVSLTTDPGFAQTLGRMGLRLADAAFDLVFPRRFNRLLSKLDNKAFVQRAALEPVLRKLVDCPEAPAEVHVVVDRLGGRKFYRRLVEELAGDAFVLTSVESPTLSRYVFERGGRRFEVAFAVQADSFSLPTALASMIAKYLRECAMAGFNAFWARQVPGVRPTAGYPGDAQRFRREVSSCLKELGVKREEFWRER